MNEKLHQAIALANQGQWHQAHRIVQNMDDQPACWLHANLHREEGDHNNAQHWYTRAGKPFPNLSIKAERKQIHASLIP